jgi:hypothetical protein
MKRKGRQHLPKVGTPQQQAYARRQGTRAVARNVGSQGRGWVFWVALVLVVGVVAFLLFGAFLWF